MSFFEPVVPRIVHKVKNDSWRDHHGRTFPKQKPHRKLGIPDKRIISRNLVLEFHRTPDSHSYMRGFVRVLVEQEVENIAEEFESRVDKIGRTYRVNIGWKFEPKTEKLDSRDFGDWYFRIGDLNYKGPPAPGSHCFDLFVLALTPGLNEEALRTIGYRLYWDFLVQVEQNRNWLEQWFPDLIHSYIYQGSVPVEPTRHRASKTTETFLVNFSDPSGDFDEY